MSMALAVAGAVLLNCRASPFSLFIFLILILNIHRIHRPFFEL